MRKPETTFISSVHKHLPYRLHYEKMNNPYRGGTADVWYSGKRADLWVEYKYLQRIPVDAVITPDCSELQLKWLRERHAEGRNVAVIVGSKTGGVILRDLEWEAPITPKEYVRRLKGRAEIARWIREQISGVTDGDTKQRHISADRGDSARQRRTSDLR